MKTLVTFVGTALPLPLVVLQLLVHAGRLWYATVSHSSCHVGMCWGWLLCAYRKERERSPVSKTPCQY